MALQVSVSRISGKELAALLRAKKDVTIIDVRDDDFAGGNIIGAENIPRDTFKYSVDEQVERLKSRTHVVFHCMLSQVRGPYCANLFARTLAAHNVRYPPKVQFRTFKNSAWVDGLQAINLTLRAVRTTAPQVSVLEGGFGSFAHDFYGEKDLFENLNENYYGKDGTFSSY